MQLLEELPPGLLLRGEHATVLSGGLLRMTAAATPAKHLKVVERPPIAAPVERLDVVHLIPVPSASSAPPAGGVQDLPADPAPAAAVERGVVAAHGFNQGLARFSRGGAVSHAVEYPQPALCGNAHRLV